MRFRPLNILIVSVLLIVSCKKDEKSGPVAGYAIHPYLVVGNYWIYETLYKDNKGNILSTGFDSTYVEKDTMIDGSGWCKIVSEGIADRVPYKRVYFWKDSLGAVVGNTGIILTNRYETPGIIKTTIIFNDNDTLYEITEELMYGDTMINIPAGTFSTKKLLYIYNYYFKPVHKYRYFYSYTSNNWPGVYVYITYPKRDLTTQFEQRLVRYRTN